MTIELTYQEAKLIEDSLYIARHEQNFTAAEVCMMRNLEMRMHPWDCKCERHV